ncbi:hypothetical protein D3C72_353260 [compost metagenome]
MRQRLTQARAGPGRLCAGLGVLREIPWQLRVARRQGLPPVGALSGQRLTLRVTLQMFGPAVQRAAFARQDQRRARRQSGVSELQVFEQNAPRHAVDHQVMDNQQQALLSIRQIHQHRPHQVPLLQIQAALGHIGQCRQSVQAVQLTHPQQLRITLGLRHCLPHVGGRLEAQRQCVVLFDQRGQRRAQMRGVERRGRLQHHRLAPVLTLGNRGCEEPRLNRQQWQRPASSRCRSRDGLGFDQFSHGGQLADGLFFEQLLGAQLDALAFGPGNDLQAEDRITTQFEEVVAAAHAFKLEHIGPDRRELFLDFTHWRDEVLSDHPRHRQGTFVEFAIGGQWQLLKQHNLRRHHVIRQARLQLLAQRLRLQGQPRRRHTPRDQLQTRRVVIQ